MFSRYVLIGHVRSKCGSVGYKWSLFIYRQHGMCLLHICSRIDSQDGEHIIYKFSVVNLSLGITLLFLNAILLRLPILD